MTPPKDSSKGHMPLFALELESQAAALDFGEVGDIFLTLFPVFN